MMCQTSKDRPVGGFGPNCPKALCALQPLIFITLTTMHFSAFRTCVAIFSVENEFLVAADFTATLLEINGVD
jgi:hypothetical protein